MYVKIALQSIAMILLYKTTANGAFSKDKERGNNVEIRLIVSEDVWQPEHIRLIPNDVTYPNAMTMTQTSFVLGHPISALTFRPYQATRSPQPSTPIPPERSILSEQSTAFTQHHPAFHGTPATRWGNLLQFVEADLKPSTVIHRPLVNYHLVPPPSVAPTTVPLQTSPTTSTTSTSNSSLTAPSFKISNDFNYSDDSGRTATSTPKYFNPDNLLNETTTGSADKKEATHKCPCNVTHNEDLSNDSVSIDDQEGEFGDIEYYEDNDDEDDSDADETSPAKTAAIRNMWEGHAPKPLLKSMLRRESIKSVEKINMGMDNDHVSIKRNDHVDEGSNPELWKQFQRGLNILQDAVEAQKRSNEIEEEIEEMHGSDFDYTHEDPEEHSSHLIHFIDFWGNKKPKYQDEFDSTEENIKESIAKYNEDLNGWDPEHRKGFWSDGGFNVKVSGSKTPARGGSLAYINGGTKRVNDDESKYVADDGSSTEERLLPRRSDLTKIYKKSFADRPKEENSDEIFNLYEELITNMNIKPVSSKWVEKESIPIDQNDEHSSSGIMTGAEQIIFENLIQVLQGNEKNKAGAYGEPVGNEGHANIKARIIDGTDKKDNGGVSQATESLTSGSAGIESRVPYDPTASEEQNPRQPVCKEVHDIGLSKNGKKNETELSHIRNLLCVKDYEDKDEDRSYSHEFEESTEMTRENDNSKEMSNENDESMFFD